MGALVAQAGAGSKGGANLSSARRVHAVGALDWSAQRKAESARPVHSPKRCHSGVRTPHASRLSRSA